MMFNAVEADCCRTLVQKTCFNQCWIMLNRFDRVPGYKSKLYFPE